MKKLLNREWFIKLWVIINPLYWAMIRRYSVEWDKELNQLMDTYVGRFGEVNSFTNEVYEIQFNTTLVWTKNYPYAYGNKIDYYNPATFFSARPSRYTIYKLRQIEKRLRMYESKNT